MSLKTLILTAALITGLSAAPSLAQQDAEINKQSPAPQGTVAPESNAKANTGASTGTSGSEEQIKTQSPGKSEDTSLSEKSKEGPGTGTSANREATNPEAPAPNNTSRPD